MVIPLAAATPREGDRPATTAPAKEPSNVIGRVVDEQGKPVRGVYVMGWLREVVGALVPGTSIRGGAGVTTDADGMYRMRRLGPVSLYDIFIPQEPSGERVAPAIEGVYVGEGETVRAPDIVLQPGAVITGVVTDRLTGMPLEGVVVAADGPHRPTALVNRNQLPLLCRTNVRGRYTLRVAPGLNLVYVVQVTPARLTEGDLIEAPVRLYQQEVEVKKGEVRDLSFQVDRMLGCPGDCHRARCLPKWPARSGYSCVCAPLHGGSFRKRAATHGYVRAVLHGERNYCCGWFLSADGPYNGAL